MGMKASGKVPQKFQSTLSMRRATVGSAPSRRRARFQSTLSMRRATGFLTVDDVRRKISIHALHEESDGTFMRVPVVLLPFQSTLSMRRATCRADGRSAWCHFNPRSP